MIDHRDGNEGEESEELLRSDTETQPCLSIVTAGNTADFTAHQAATATALQSTFCFERRRFILILVSTVFLLLPCLLFFRPSSNLPFVAPVLAGVSAGRSVIGQYELCRRAESTLEDVDVSLLGINHFLLPYGSFSFPSANLSMPALSRPSWPEHPLLLRVSASNSTYIELYVQETLYVPVSRQWKIGVILVAGGDRAVTRDGHYDQNRYDGIMQTLAADLILEFSSASAVTTSQPAVFSRLITAKGLWWLFFQLSDQRDTAAAPHDISADGTSKAEDQLASSGPLLLTLSHPTMKSASSTCASFLSASRSPWCSPPAFPSPSSSALGALPFLRISVCPRAYRPVDFSYCSNAVHTEQLVPHLRSFLTYHAYLGIHRFVSSSTAAMQKTPGCYNRSSTAVW